MKVFFNFVTFKLSVNYQTRDYSLVKIDNDIQIVVLDGLPKKLIQ